MTNAAMTYTLNRNAQRRRRAAMGLTPPGQTHNEVSVALASTAPETLARHAALGRAWRQVAARLRGSVRRAALAAARSFERYVAERRAGGAL